MAESMKETAARQSNSVEPCLNRLSSDRWMNQGVRCEVNDDQSVWDLSIPFPTENTLPHELANLQQFEHTSNAGLFPSLGPEIGDYRFAATAPLLPPIITPPNSGYPPIHPLQPQSAAYAPSQLQSWQHSLAESSSAPCQSAFPELNACASRDSNPSLCELNRGPADSRPPLNHTLSQTANQFYDPNYASNSLQLPRGDDYHELLATSNFASTSFAPDGPQQADEVFGQALESSQELDEMSSQRRITRSSAALSTSPPPPEAGRISQPRIKRRRLSPSPPVPSHSLRVVIDDSDDLFGSDDEELTHRTRDLTKKEEEAETKPQLEIINLEDTDEVPEALRRQEASGRTPLGALQCVICMDDAKNLTVTHCGHLFCGECLHSSLNIDATRKICPICRQKLDAKPTRSKFSAKAKGYYNLELKLMSKVKVGKRRAKS